MARTVENQILSILTLWYYGTRKLSLDETSSATETPRKLLNFFSAVSNRDRYPDCNLAYETVYACFNNNTFFGRNAENLKETKKKEMIKEHFTEVFKAGLPNHNWKISNDSELNVFENVVEE